jgi:hypothetical protein
MLRIACPHCNRRLRIDDASPGELIACPACGKEFAWSVEDEETTPPPEPEEQVRPVHKKKKRPKSRPSTAGSDPGRRAVIVIIAVVAGMHLLSLVRYLSTSDTLEQSKKILREAAPTTNKGPSADVAKQIEKEMEKVYDSPEMKNLARRAKVQSLVWLIGGVSLSALLLTFLYLRHNWARVVLGVLYLLGGALGVFGLLLGGFALIRALASGAAALVILESIVRIVVTLGIGTALLGSESIAQYTSGSRSRRD